MTERVIARSCVYAKIGELVQGKLTPTEDFIIPGITSSKFCTKTFIYESDKPEFSIPENVFPALYIYQKLVDGVELKEISKAEIEDISIVKDFVYASHSKIKVVQHSNIPIGKGLSAGSTNIMGLLLALNKYYNTKFGKETLYQITAKILPADPVLDKEIDRIFNPLTGEKVFNLISKQFGVIYFDSESSTTLNPYEIFQNFNYNSADYVAFNEILEFYQTGSMTNDDQLVYKAITMSAQINQEALPKPKFDLMVEFAEQNKMGVFVGHTGTVMGFVMDASIMQDEFPKVQAFIKEHWNAKAYYDSCEQSVIKIF